MSKQSDIEFLFILAAENYSQHYKISYQETVELFHNNHILEKMLVQHEFTSSCIGKCF